MFFVGLELILSHEPYPQGIWNPVGGQAIICFTSKSSNVKTVMVLETLAL